MAAVAAKQFLTLTEKCEALGLAATRPVIVLKAGVTRLAGQLIDPETGVVLAAEEAYETVHGRVRVEPLGSVTRFGARPRFR